MNRRHFLKTLGTAAVIGSGSKFLAGCESGTTPIDDPGGRKPQPLRIPQTMLGSGELIASMGTYDIWKNVPSNVITINGAFLGPTIKIRKGNTLNVRFTNNLMELSNIHWHGLNVPADMDGHPKDAILSGQHYQYTFPIVDRAGTYWYHAHPDMRTGYQAYMGHAGVLIVNDDEEDVLGLPSREFDIPLVLQDKRLNEKNAIIWDKTRDDIPPGYLGDTIFVNGTPEAYHDVGKTLYRLRLINASNARLYNIGFEDNRTMHLIANDGGLLDKPYPMQAILFGPGERIEILVDFSGDVAGTSVKLKSLEFPFTSSHQNPLYPQGKEMDILTFNIKTSPTNSAKVPSALTNFERLDTGLAVRTRHFSLSMDHTAEYGQHQIDGLVFDMNRIDHTVKAGDLEIWEFENQGDAIHTMHLHSLQFQVIDRSFTNLRPNDLGWKDTVLVGPSEMVRIAVRFNQLKGVFLFHCHNLEHEDDGMMLNFEVV
jgi:FtsP/CotA-like multicopper oxidase with cupredoxin domain